MRDSENSSSCLPWMQILACGFVLLILANLASAQGINHLLAGNEAARRGEFDKAISLFTQAIETRDLSQENLAMAFNNRGFAYFRRHQYDRAIENYDIAIRLKSDYTEAFYNRGMAYHNKGQHDRAIVDYDAAIRLDPNYTRALESRAYINSSIKGQYNLAIQDYDRLTGLKPNNARVFYNRGRMSFYLGDFAKAQPDFLKALELQPSNSYYALSLYLARARGGRDGRSELERNARRLDLKEWPGQVVEFYLGKITRETLMASAKNPDALLEKVLHRQAYFYLGQHMLLRGDKEAAIKLFRLARDTEDENIGPDENSRVELKRLSP